MTSLEEGSEERMCLLDYQIPLHLQIRRSPEMTHRRYNAEVPEKVFRREQESNVAVTRRIERVRSHHFTYQSEGHETRFTLHACGDGSE